MIKIILIIFFTTCIVSLFWLTILIKEINEEMRLINEHDKEIKEYKKFHYEQIEVARKINGNLIKEIEGYKTKGEEQC